MLEHRAQSGRIHAQIIGKIIHRLATALIGFDQSRLAGTLLVMVGLSVLLLEHLIAAFVEQPPLSWVAAWGALWLAKLLAGLSGWLLILSASWTAWRNAFTAKAWGLAVLAFFFGGAFLMSYLLWLYRKHGGNWNIILLGEHHAKG